MPASTNFSPDATPVPLKVLIGGGFGVGKTTFVGSVSEIPVLTTEEVLTNAGVGVDSLDGLEAKSTTTVALDFGRISFVSAGVIMYLFGTPGQDRFWFMWEELSYNALGAVVLVDTRKVADSWPAIEFFESRGIAYVVAVNDFDGAPVYQDHDIRDALRITDEIPLVRCDARIRKSAAGTLIELIDYLMSILGSGSTTTLATTI